LTNTQVLESTALADGSDLLINTPSRSPGRPRRYSCERSSSLTEACATPTRGGSCPSASGSAGRAHDAVARRRYGDPIRVHDPGGEAAPALERSGWIDYDGRAVAGPLRFGPVCPILSIRRFDRAWPRARSP
jgi:hypothetical protein